MAYVIKQATTSKNTVNTGEQFKISVAVLTWDYLKKNYTYNSLKDSGMKWGDMVRSDT